MRRYLALTVVLLFSALGVQAQQPFGVTEVFAGYSYLDEDSIAFAPSWNANGWAVSVSGRLPERLNLFGDPFEFGWAAEAAGQYGTRAVTTPMICINLAIFPCPFDEAQVNGRAAQYIAGPRLSVHGKRASAFGHVLFGVAQSRTGSFLIDTTLISAATTTDFAMILGSGLDINLNDRWAIRAIQADFVPVRRGSVSWAGKFRLQAGIVYRFGR